MNKQYLLFFICLIAINSSVYAATAERQKAELQKLEKRCADAREKKIAPLRQKAVKECIAKDSSTSRAKKEEAKERCERRNIDYGSGVRNRFGGHEERMFNDLPVCLEFYEAERKYKAKSLR